MLSPSPVKQILVRCSLQLQLLSRVSQVWLPVDSKPTECNPMMGRHTYKLTPAKPSDHDDGIYQKMDIEGKKYSQQKYSLAAKLQLVQEGQDL